MEEIFDEDDFPLSCDIDGSAQKHKSHAKSCLKKSRRIKINRNKIKSK
jgi:hypothetical protein